MASSRKKKSSRTGTEQKNTYSFVLGQPLRLVDKTDLTTQNNPKRQLGNALAGGRRSTDSFDLYLCWLSLSPREKDVTFLTYLGYKNQKIAFEMGISVATVKSYLRLVFLKIKVHSKTELLLKFANFDFKHNSPPIAGSTHLP